MNAVIFPFPAVLQLCGRIAFGDGELCEPTMHFHTQFSPININIDGFPIPEIRFSPTPRDAGHNSPSPKAMTIHDKYTAGINKLRLWASLVNPYCAKHDLPSPTDSVSPFPGSQFPTHRLRRISNCRFPISNTPSPMDFQLPVSESRFTVPGCRIWCRRGAGCRRLQW